jgi:cobalt/nickel transport system permease protein
VHLADGIVAQAPAILSMNLLGACAVATAASCSLRQGARGAAWTGTLAAFVLAAQALNVPILPGTSAHVIGSGLLALTLGPSRAIVAGFAVLLVQALLFADGGITVLGVNTLNIAVIPVLAVHGCRRLFGDSPRGLAFAAVIGVVLGNLAGAASLSLALTIGAGTPAGVTFSWLLGVQALAGIVEGLLTALAVRGLFARAPALFHQRTRAECELRALDSDDLASEPRAAKIASLRAVAITVGIVIALLPLASASPDALAVVLEHVRTAR